MKGYKCDNCGAWSEFTPASEGIGRYMGMGNNSCLNHTSIKLEVYRDGNTRKLDLCEKCTIDEIAKLLDKISQEVKHE